tara:strand:+ start:1277 stop:1444 length:168 start_codon:yes stop_codon:yes gene_type:complete
MLGSDSLLSRSVKSYEYPVEKKCKEEKSLPKIDSTPTDSGNFDKKACSPKRKASI